MPRALGRGPLGASVPPQVVVTIAAVADQTGLATVSPTVSATIDRGDGGGAVAATITAWSWKLNGATTGITGPTTETPSINPAIAGLKTLTVDVTIDGVVYSAAPEVFTVGDSGQWLRLDPSTWTKVAGSASLVTALSAESVTLAAINADAEAEWDSFYGAALDDGEYLVCLEALGIDTSTAIIMVGLVNRAAPTDAGGRFAGIGETAAGAVSLYTNLGGSTGATTLACEKVVIHFSVTNSGTKIIGNEVVVYGALGNIVGSYPITAGNTASTVTTAGLAVIFARNGAPPAAPVTLSYRVSYCKLSLPSELG